MARPFVLSIFNPSTVLFSTVVTCHPSLEISSLGFTDMILLWLFFHGQLQFPLVVALPPPVTWRNLVTPKWQPSNSVFALWFTFVSVLSLRNYLISWSQSAFFRCMFLKGPLPQITFQPPAPPGQAAHSWNLGFKPNLRPNFYGSFFCFYEWYHYYSGHTSPQSLSYPWSSCLFIFSQKF